MKSSVRKVKGGGYHRLANHTSSTSGPYGIHGIHTNPVGLVEEPEMKESKSGGASRQDYRKDQHHVDAHHLFLRVIELEKEVELLEKELSLESTSIY